MTFSSFLPHQAWLVRLWAALLLLVVVVVDRTMAQTYQDATASIADRVDDLLSLMTLREKIGQMVMDIENAEQKAPDIGSYIIGASDPPPPNTPQAWRQRQNELQTISANTRLGIPLMIGTDAVHGQNIISGGTVFPHNIGLGATRHPSLLREIAGVTADEMITSGLDFTFAPTIAVAKTITWGRTYESYSEDTDIVRSYVVDFIEGLQGDTTPWRVAATAKHWIGDGGTTLGTDAGDTAMTEQELMDIHGTPYIDAINADVGVVMVSFSSFNGEMLHQHQHLIENVLKGDLGFEGFVLSDWEGYTRNPGDYDTQLLLAVNAGIDMMMAPYQAFGVLASITNSVNNGLISEERINDAARRILTVKFKSGLFENKVQSIDPNVFEPIGSTEHREVARRAVRESLVLLKNSNDRLPLDPAARIFLAGKSADNAQNQCGGWTMSWQGDSTEARHAIVGATTFYEGFQQEGTGTVELSADGLGANPAQHDVAIVIIGETPYAEFEGDDSDLSLDAQDLAVINNVKASGVPMVLVVVSGRPMIITDEIDGIDAVVAAWLPGTEGDGLAEVLFGQYNFKGKLSFSWPANMAQVLTGFVGDNPDVLYPLGHGLTYASVVEQTQNPTSQPLTDVPTQAPALAPSPRPTLFPTFVPTPGPTTEVPTSTPTSSAPAAPSSSPQPTNSMMPSAAPTKSPQPSASPSSVPSVPPSAKPTPPPTDAPTPAPTPQKQPSKAPVKSSPSPTSGPTERPPPDFEPPSTPGTPFLTEITSSSITFTWTSSTDNVAVKQYDIYDESKLVGRPTDTSFTASGLESGSLHRYSVVARDAAGNESPTSNAIVVSTLLLVDDFADGNELAEENWGEWRTYHDGTAGDGSTVLETKASGYKGFGVSMSYIVDSGDWGLCNVFLDYDEGESIDLTASDISGAQFKMRGQAGSSFYLLLGTPLGLFNAKYYRYALEPTSEWTTVAVDFDNFVGDSGIPYSLTDALKNTTTLVWETDTVGSSGWISLDEVEFMTPFSTLSRLQNQDKGLNGGGGDGGGGGGGGNGGGSSGAGFRAPSLLLLAKLGLALLAILI